MNHRQPHLVFSRLWQIVRPLISDEKIGGMLWKTFTLGNKRQSWNLSYLGFCYSLISGICRWSYRWSYRQVVGLTLINADKIHIFCKSFEFWDVAVEQMEQTMKEAEELDVLDSLFARPFAKTQSQYSKWYARARIALGVLNVSPTISLTSIFGTSFGRTHLEMRIRMEIGQSFECLSRNANVLICPNLSPYIVASILRTGLKISFWS